MISILYILAKTTNIRLKKICYYRELGIPIKKFDIINLITAKMPCGIILIGILFWLRDTII